LKCISPSTKHQNSKFQIPSTKIQTKSKYQTFQIQNCFEFEVLSIGIYLDFGAWNLEFVWDLVLGAWNLFGIWCLVLGILLLLRRVSLMRPAPVELPQGRKAARVDG
jgi:hypothetical protein